MSADAAPPPIGSPGRGEGGRVVAEPPFDHPRRPLAQKLGAILWPSFFSACVGTAVFFAFVDPLALRDISFPGVEMRRETGYTIAFFLFWSATAGASLFTWILLRPASRFNAPLPRD
jgi:hypothetical protein